MGGITMKVTTKLINDIVTKVVGQEALHLVEFLRPRKNVSEFIIADKTKTEIHQVRNLLYRLHSHNLAEYKRKKDSQKGYYISYWTFNPKRVKDVASDLVENEMEKLRERLQKEERHRGNFYLCTNACVRLNFEQSTDVDFKCPECGTLLNQQDNSRTIEVLRERLREMEATAVV